MEAGAEPTPMPNLDDVGPVDDDTLQEDLDAPLNSTEHEDSINVPSTSSASLHCLQTPPHTQSFSTKPVASDFPLSPPGPSQVLTRPTRENSTPIASSESDSESDFDFAESLLANLRPKLYHSPSLINEPTKTLSDDHNSVQWPPSPSPSIKRRATNSPCIQNQPPPKKPKFVLTEEEERSCLMISDSDEETSAKSATEAELRLASQPSRPAPKPKPKRKSSGLSASTSSSTVQSRHPGSRPHPTSSYRKHDVYWHLDGNILVQIGTTRFRLHRSILARQSKWFEEKFNQRETAAELVSAGADDDIPLCDLSDKDITVEDFEGVLCASEDTVACFREGLPFEKLNSLLRTSTTLRFTIIEKYAASALSNMWSADLEDVGVDRIEHPPESLALARQCALFPVIKRSLYELVRLSNFGQTKVMPGDISSASEVRLGAYDKDILLSAREQLSIAWRQTLDVDQFSACAGNQADVATSTDGNPTHPISCTTTNRALLLVAHHEIVKERGISNFEYDPVWGLQVLAAAPWKEKNFCEACVTQREERWLEERERIWRKLDEWFEV